MIIERNRNRKESVKRWPISGRPSNFEMERGGCIGYHTKDELLGRRKHIKRECDFVLIAFALEPTEKGRCVEHSAERWASAGKP